MRPLTFSCPKPLLPLLNKPVTSYILDHLSAHGVSEVAITTNYLREQIMGYYGPEYNGLRLHFPAEEKPLGTAGCVKNIEDFFDDTFIVMQGDTITDVDLRQLVIQHKYASGLATIAAVKVEDPWNYGTMDLADDGRVRQFHEKPLMDQCTSNLVNTGIYVLEPEALDHVPKDTFYDFAKDLFPVLMDSKSLFAHQTDAFWADVGRPAGYVAAKKWLMSGIKNDISDSAQVEGRLEGNVVFGENVKVGRHSQIFGPVVLGDGVVLERGCVVGPYTVLGSGVTVREYTMLNGAVLFEKTEIGSKEEVSDSLIAEKCRIGSGGVIQSDVMIGGSCLLQGNVSVINGSRIWPNMEITENSMVSGTLRRFVQLHEIRDDPRWSLRSVNPDEGFYFNKLESNRVMYTGLRALSLLDFDNLLKHVDLSSVNYHMRSDVNDFSQWMQKIICDPVLAETFNDIKRECSQLDARIVRHRMIEATNDRLNGLLNAAKPKGYV